MATRVLSIEIGQVITKICEVESRSKNPKVYKNFMVATPEGVIVDGAVQASEEYVRRLKEALTKNKVSAKKAVFSISSTRIASREVTIPYVKDNKIGEVVNAKAEEYFPVDLAEYKVTYSLLGITEDDKGNKKHKVLVLAVPLKLLQGYYDLASACGLEIAALDYVGNSLFQAVKNTCIEGTQMVAKIDAHSTLVMIVQDGHLVSIRNVTYGVEEAIGVLAGEDRNYLQAITDLRRNCYIQANATEEGQSKEKAVTDALGYLVNGISRIIDFHNPRSNGHPIEKIYITGLGGSFKGMSDLIQERLGLAVAVIGDIDGLVKPKEMDSANLGDYVACIGAAMDPLDLLIASKKDKKQKAAKGAGNETDRTGLAVIVCAGGVMIALILAVVALVPYKAAQAENKRLLNRIEELQPVETVYNTYVAAQNLWLDADSMYALTENHNDDLVAFIQELEQKMPSDIIVLSMMASADNVTLNIEVSSKESAAKVLQELRAFESIEVVQTTGLTDVREEDIHVVSFSVNCNYVGAQEEIPVAAMQETQNEVQDEAQEEMQ